jgi:type I restriction-modification system DNA methylase subunit
MSYNIKSIKEEFKAKGIFYTQPELAEYMKSLVNVPITDVYDPTCGDGSLLACFPDDLPKFGQELNDHQLKVASERLKNFTGFCGDTLENPAFLDKKFSCIVANPPFSIKWNPPVGLFKDARFDSVPTLPPQSKAESERNYQAQRKMTNSQLEDRQKRRVEEAQANGRTTASVNDYMNKYGL